MGNRKRIAVAVLVAGGFLCGVCRAETQPAAAAASVATPDYQQLATSYKRTPSPQILYQLGTLAAAEGRTTEAQDLMRRYLADLAADPSSPAYKEAEKVVARPRGPSGEVDVLGDRGALVLLDERLVGALPLSLPLLLSAGDHQIQLERGRRRVKAPVKVLDGRGTVIRFNLDSNAALVSQPPAVVIVPDLPTPPALSLSLFRTAEKAVRRANQAVFNTTVAMAKAQDQARCLSTPECQVKLGQRNEIDYVMTMRITLAGAPNNPDYLLALKLLDVGAGDFAAQVERKCTACSAEQLVSAMGEAAKEVLHSGVGRARGTLAITSEPAGAGVFAADKRLGNTPYRAPAWAGSQELRLALPGYLDERLATTVAAGEVATYAVQFKPGITPAPASDSGLIAGRPRGRFIAGAVMGGAGVVLLVVGVRLLTDGLGCIDFLGSCSGANTQAIAGGSLLAIGLALGGTGALMMGIPAKSK